MESARVVIIGGGILGCAVAYALADAGVADVVVLEAEDSLNHHSSGRNASYYIPMYDSDAFSHLAHLSEPFLAAQEEAIGYAEQPILRRCGAVIATLEHAGAQLRREVAHARSLGVEAEELCARDIATLIPIVRTQLIASAAFYPRAGEINVNALSMGYIRSARTRGVEFLLSRRVTSIKRSCERITGVVTPTEVIKCNVVVNAAGAWAQKVGNLARGTNIPLTPYRRHLVCVSQTMEKGHARWPFFRCPSIPLYFKAEEERLLCSPMDEEADIPGDCRTEITQVTKAVDMLNQYTTLSSSRAHHAWAGHRVFASDRVPVIGADPSVSGLYWAAGLGGAGVMASPAVGHLIAESVLGHGPPRGILARMGPERFVG
jgi:D-arginine dehydrogenase